jgi:hypothetical protein
MIFVLRREKICRAILVSMSVALLASAAGCSFLGKPPRVSFFEAEQLTVIDPNGVGGYESQYLGSAWSGERHLFWWGSHSGVGSTLSISVPLIEAGTYAVTGVFTMAADYGMVQLYFNDEPIGQPLDFYSPTLQRSQELFLGEVQLNEGNNVLKVEIVGKNEKSPNYLFGLDYIRLVRR